MRQAVILAIGFTCAAFSLVASADSAQPLFADDSALKVRIEGPLTTLMRERSDVDYLDGSLSYLDTDGVEQVLDLKFRARGIFRRQLKICEFPPVRLNFDKDQVPGTLFEGQDKLKLVTHCDPNRDYYQQLVLKEYLAYRIYQLLTPYSFDVRLLLITWYDTDRNRTVERYGFVIEHHDRMAERLGMELIEEHSVDQGDVDHDLLVRSYLFQYLIGNTDFSMLIGPPDDECCHNAKVFRRPDAPIVSIPYDFDMSGLVNAPYAVPNPRFRLRNVRERLWRGSCAMVDELPALLAELRELRASIMSIINELEGLIPRHRRQVEKYLEDFYDDMDNSRTVERTFRRGC